MGSGKIRKIELLIEEKIRVIRETCLITANVSVQSKSANANTLLQNSQVVLAGFLLCL